MASLHFKLFSTENKSRWLMVGGFSMLFKSYRRDICYKHHKQLLCKRIRTLAKFPNDEVLSEPTSTKLGYSFWIKHCQRHNGPRN